MTAIRHPGSLLKELDLDKAQFLALVSRAAELKRAKAEGAERLRLAGRNIALIFEKSSTRTRCPFDVAAHDQGAHTTYLGAEGSHIGRGESIPDTARVLGRMFDGIEFPGLPTWAAGGPARLDHRHGRRPVAAHRGRTGRSGPGSGVAWEGAKQIMSADQGQGVRVQEEPLTNKGTAFFEEEQHAQRSDFGEGLPRRGPPAPPPHSQSTQEKGTEKHDNADEQQIHQALDDDAHDAEHDRHDHEE
jgi:hypothetical protein